ncbi:MAG: DUF4339 domain-containing protein [Phycisphaerales bacterium]|nr:DUF4339 domain-containing protein [Phycisphaerales bacterium]
MTAEGYIYVDDSGVQHGPFDGQALQAMAQQGQLHANTYVRHTNETEWSLASTWPWLGFAAAPAVAATGAGGSAQMSQAWRNLAQRTNLSQGTLLGIIIGIVVIIALVIVFMSGGGGPKGAVNSMQAASTAITRAVQSGDANGMIDGLEHLVEGMEQLAKMKDQIEAMPTEEQMKFAGELMGSMAGLQSMAQLQSNPQMAQEMMTNPALQARLENLQKRMRDAQRSMP